MFVYMVNVEKFLDMFLAIISQLLLLCTTTTIDNNTIIVVDQGNIRMISYCYINGSILFLIFDYRLVVSKHIYISVEISLSIYIKQ